MKFQKSSRHHKLTGYFGESLVLYWLSRHGFECALVDHTGIDIIARRPDSEEVMGISVKSRSRSAGTEATSLKIEKVEVLKVEQACHAFGCIPYWALVIDAGGVIQVFILSQEHLLTIYPGGNSIIAWQMSPRRLEQYRADPEIKRFEFRVQPGTWWE